MLQLNDRGRGEVVEQSELVLTVWSDEDMGTASVFRRHHPTARATCSGLQPSRSSIRPHCCRTPISKDSQPNADNCLRTATRVIGALMLQASARGGRGENRGYSLLVCFGIGPVPPPLVKLAVPLSTGDVLDFGDGITAVARTSFGARIRRTLSGLSWCV